MKSIRRTTKISASRLALAAAAALLLSACTQDGGFLAGLGAGLGAGGGEKPAAEAPAEGSADGKAADESAAGAPAPAEAQEATLPPPPITAPAELIGRESAEVAALLGAPSFERRDGPAEIWQYRGAACILDVFLYKEKLGRLVRHAELRRRNGEEISDLDCLTDLFAARAEEAN